MRALAGRDTGTYCGSMRESVIGVRSTARLSGKLLELCHRGILFESFGEYDSYTVAARSSISRTSVKGDRATVRLSRGGAMELAHQDGAWYVTCIATKPQLQAHPDLCLGGE